MGTKQMRHWMFLTHPDNWEKCLEHGLFGFDEEYAYTVEHYVQPGDQAMVYLAKESSVWGVVEITEVLLNQTEPIGWLKKGWEARRGEQIEGRFPARVRFREVCRIDPPRRIAGPLNECRNELEYITDKKRWNVFVQIALSRVPEADVQTVLRWAAQPTIPPSPRAAQPTIPPSPHRGSGVRSRRRTGKDLARKWGVVVKHALYNEDGKWYENLKRFPGALFDPHGYVVFATEQQYRDCSHLKIGKKLNIPDGISSIPGYKPMS